MDEKSHRPLSLYEVLREEFLLLHGHLPPDDKDHPGEGAKGEPDSIHDTLPQRESAAEAEAGRGGREAAALARHFSFVHRLPKRRAALCLSGRDGRSAAYTLGVLQGLAERELLPEFDYLSTAGGGSCVGAWLASWVEQHPAGLKGVCEELKERRRAPFGPEPEPVRRLRENRERLDTRARFLFADPWVSALQYLRNLLLNLMVLLPLFAAALCLPRLFAAVLDRVPLGAGRDVMLLAALAMALAVSFPIDNFGWSVKFRRWFMGLSILSQAYPLLPATLMALWWGWQDSGLREDRDVILLGRTLPGLLVFAVYGLLLGGWPQSLTGSGPGKKGSRRWTTVLLSRWAGGIAGGLVCWAAAWLLLSRVTLSEADPWGFGYYVCLSVPIFLTPLVVMPLVSQRLMADDWESSLRRVKAALVAALTWGGVSTLVVFGPVFLGYAAGSVVLIALVVGLLVFVLGDAAAALAHGRRVAGRLWRSMTASGVGATLSSIAVAVIIAAVSLGTTYLFGEWARAFPDWAGRLEPASSAAASHLYFIRQTPPALVLGLAALMVAWSLLLARFVDANVLSSRHAFLHWLKGAYLTAVREKFGAAGDDAPLRDDFPLRDLHPLLLRPRDFVDVKTGADTFQRFIFTLRTSDDKISKYLIEQMPTVVRERLQDKKSFVNSVAPFKRDVISNLNRVLHGYDFTEVVLKSGLPLPERGMEALRLYEETQFKGYIFSFNRMILRLVYPEVFRDVQMPREWMGHRYDDTEPADSEGAAYALMPVFNVSRKVSRRERYGFTVSPLHAGGVESGYRRAGEYGGPDGLMLSTAAALSANPRVAPASPRPPLATRILYALLNVRQGWWLANPGGADADKVSEKRAEPTLLRLLSDSFWSRRREEGGDYVNLSGGDEFDPLGVYQMVLRRCGVIVAIDGSEDASHEFEALGDCLRRVRLDLGVPILFEGSHLLGGGAGGAPRRCAGGRVLYAVVDAEAEDGVFVYVRPVVTGAEPREVLSFAEAHAEFPKRGSSGVYFTEDEFESYRALGLHAVKAMCGGDVREASERAEALGRVPKPIPLSRFAELAQGYVSKPPDGRAESDYYLETRGAAAPAVERKLEKLIELVGRPVLYNYEGALCAAVRGAGREGEGRRPGEGGRLLPGQTYALEVWLAPAAPAGVLSEPVSIRNGETADTVEFEVTVKSSAVRFERDGETLMAPTRGPSQNLQFYFTAPEPGETQEVFVRLLQMNRLVQVLRVPVETAGAAAPQEVPAT